MKTKNLITLFILIVLSFTILKLSPSRVFSQFAGPTSPPAPPSGGKMIDDRDPNISYATTWVNVNNVTGAYKNTLKRSKTPNDTATLNFTGTSAWVRLSEAQNRGMAAIIIDGASKTVDTYGPPNSGVVWFGPYNVSAGSHTLVIKVIHTKNPRATDFNVALDAIRIYGGGPGGGGGGGTGTPGGPTKPPVNLLPEQIPIGSKDTLTINIGGGGVGGPSPTGGTTPAPGGTAQVRFGIKLYGVEKTPDIKVRLKVTDLVAQLTPAPSQSADTCQNPGPGQFFFKDITMSADSNGVYHPKDGTTFNILPGATTGTVSGGGWLTLSGVATGRIYSLAVKGEKHVSSIMVNNVVLNDGQASGQDFDWTAKPLQGGDVPDPSNNSLQDCIVNANDVSLVKSAIEKGGNDPANLNTADLDYNGVLNSADMAILTTTLSTKPDDE